MPLLAGIKRFPDLVLAAIAAFISVRYVWKYSRYIPKWMAWATMQVDGESGYHRHLLDQPKTRRTQEVRFWVIPAGTSA